MKAQVPVAAAPARIVAPRKRGRPARAAYDAELRDFKLDVRYRALVAFGIAPDVARELAGYAPDVYGYVLRITNKKDAASAALSSYIDRYRRARDDGFNASRAAASAWGEGSGTMPSLSQLEDSEKPLHASSGLVRAAVAKWRPATERLVVRTFERLQRALPVEQALLKTCRECGYGPGRKGGNGAGLSEVKRVLLKAGHTEVNGVKLKTRRAPRRRAGE